MCMVGGWTMMATLWCRRRGRIRLTWIYLRRDSMNRIEEISDYVGGGCAQNLSELCQSVLDCTEDDLTREELCEWEEKLFTCDQCEWTMPIEELSESESSDGFLCLECDGEIE